VFLGASANRTVGTLQSGVEFVYVKKQTWFAEFEEGRKYPLKELE
jgi:hypothetical protein